MKKLVFNFTSKETKNIKIPKNVGHYSLMSKQVVERINNLPEVNRYINGLRAISSYKYTFISVIKNKRKSGKSKMSLKNLFDLNFSFA